MSKMLFNDVYSQVQIQIFFACGGPMFQEFWEGSALQVFVTEFMAGDVLIYRFIGRLLSNLR